MAGSLALFTKRPPAGYAKPHLSYRFYTCWCCHQLGYAIGWGDTPAKAYAAWQMMNLGRL